MMPNPFAGFGAIDIVESRLFGMERQQFRRPRSKSRRIRRKWARDPRNFRMVDNCKVYRMGNTYYASPKAYAQIIAATEGR